MTEQPVVLVVGSLHHDIVIDTPHLPRVDETAVGRRWYPKFGGKGGNQAVAAVAAGVGARMVGAVGRDSFGVFLTASLDKAGVDRRFLQVIEAAGSGMSVAIVEDSGDYAATIVSGANLHLDPAALLDGVLWQEVAVLVLQNEIPDVVNLAAAGGARARSVPVILNAAPARAIPDALRLAVDVLIVNAVEAQMMGAGAIVDLPSAQAAAVQLGRDYRSVIVTAGATGLAAFSAETGVFSLPARRVEAISTHGAGDCFTGTLAAALARGAGLREACLAASEAAADHVARPVQGEDG